MDVTIGTSRANIELNDLTKKHRLSTAPPPSKDVANQDFEKASNSHWSHLNPRKRPPTGPTTSNIHPKDSCGDMERYHKVLNKNFLGLQPVEGDSKSPHRSLINIFLQHCRSNGEDVLGKRTFC